MNETKRAWCRHCDRIFDVLSGQLLLHCCPVTKRIHAVENVPQPTPRYRRETAA